MQPVSSLDEQALAAIAELERRVVAADGRLGTSGVYELALGNGRWRLRTVVD